MRQIDLSDIRSIVEIYEENILRFRDLPAVTDYIERRTFSYADLGRYAERLHAFFRQVGVRRGDKIALVGRNNAAWVMTYAATLTYGAVIVPILSDFNPVDMANIIRHSDAVLLFSSEAVWRRLSDFSMDSIMAAVNTDTLSVLTDSTPDRRIAAALEDSEAEIRRRFPSGYAPDGIRFARPGMDDVAIISYTSGTTGFSKGVMLTVGNISYLVRFAMEHAFHHKGSQVLSLLPLAHAYGCAFDMLSPLAAGSHIHLLGKMPTPRVLLSAMAEVRPNLICTVPLVMEKLVRGFVLPKLEGRAMRVLTRVPLVSMLIYRRIGRALLNAFGGAFQEVNMGGAALSPDVEALLRKVGFPYTVGYGMTECAPLVCYSRHEDYIPHTCGALLPGMSIMTVDRDGRRLPDGEIGEICLKGPNVMAGYYKNPEATASAIDSDGWLHTGDIGFVDPNGVVSLRGRSKTMILASNGQNIYPEEIESKLNAMELVKESLVHDRNGRIEALVVPDFDKAAGMSLSNDALREIMERNLSTLNTLVAPYERVAAITVCSREFEKTPKKSIKRFLYPEAAVPLK